MLLRYSLIRPATVRDVDLLLIGGGDGDGDTEPAAWRWAAGGLRNEVYSLLLGFNDASGDRATAQENATELGGGIPNAWMRQLDAEPVVLRPVLALVDQDLAEHFKVGLLGTHRRRWHRLAAEFFEGQLAASSGQWERAGTLVLAHHWSEATLDVTEPDNRDAAVAARQLFWAAGAAVTYSAPAPALEMLRRASSLLERVHYDGSAKRRTAILQAAAPCTLLVHGPGSAEAVAAYSALTAAADIPEHGPINSLCAAALAGGCANLLASGRDYAAAQVPARSCIIASRL